MKVNVHFFKPSGKWYASCVVEVSERHPYWSEEFKREIAERQTAVLSTDGCGFWIVVTHRDDYDSDPSSYFCQCMYRG